MAIKRDKKEEEDGGNPFLYLDKTSVLQEARTFNETPVNPRKCTPILTKILYLLNQGEQLGTTEATETFFAMTKLFQSKNVVLRRLVYLGIKELSSIAEDVIIVTSSLTKDMTGKEDLYRAAAIRALCSITDASMLHTIERYMKQAIVDRNPSVASAALVSSLHMSRIAGDVVKRWVNEVQEALNSDSVMAQYHALGVLYHIRKTDRLAVSKLVAKLVKSPPKAPFAMCLVIRIACKLLDEESTDFTNSPLFDFVESCLRHKSETVVYEAAGALVNLRHVTSRQIALAVSVLQLFCSSQKPALRFAAVRTLNKVAMSHPSAVMSCNLDLENLITDSNRSIATLAITTLLKTGAESAVDRLMKQISTFVSEISDEFKIVVVQAIRSLCLKFPRKHTTLMTFLSAMLREEGGVEYKASIADTIITIIEDNPDAKETGLAHLCEFIEDCEHTSLAVRILHLLGKEGPKTKQPSRYIRFIYNRVILENPIVRAAAVSSLAQFGACCPDLLPNILVLLSRCQLDSDDEVRDRASYYYCILALGDHHLTSTYIIEPLQVCISTLEKALYMHLTEKEDTPFDMKSVPLAPKPATEEIAPAAVAAAADGMIITPGAGKVSSGLVKEQENYVEKLMAVPQIAQLGPPFKSSDPVELTESETEYVVKCVKHIYSDYLVFQFECRNTLNDQLLEKVWVQVEPNESFTPTSVTYIPCPRLSYNQTAYTYAIMGFPDDLPSTICSFSTTLRFIVKDCDPATGEPDTDDGYDDEYILEEVEMTVADQMQRVTKVNFGTAWDDAAEVASECEEIYTLSSVSTVEAAVASIVNFLGMQPADRSDRVQPEKSSHALYLSGVFRGGIEVLARAKFAMSSDGVNMQLIVRSSPDIAKLITCSVV